MPSSDTSYGRLDIYWPDGPVQGFALTKEIVAVGRSPGNDLTLDRTGISRYHATLKVENGQIYIEDKESVNGTYVDGIRLQVDAAHPLNGGEEIQIGEIRMVYQPPVSIADTMKIKDDTTCHIEVPYLMVHLIGPKMVLSPGSHIHVPVLIENLTDTLRRYELDVEGIPRQWVRLERRVIELDPEEQIQMRISIKPHRRSDSTPGTYNAALIIHPQNMVDNLDTDLLDEKKVDKFETDSGITPIPESKSGAEENLETRHNLSTRVMSEAERAALPPVKAEFRIQIGTYSGYGVAMGTPLIQRDEPFTMHIHNQGNAPLTLNFRGADPENALSYAIQPHQITLTAGQRQRITGTLKPLHGNIFGNPREYQYDIISHSQDAAGFQAAVSGRYIARPLMPAWVATLTVPLVAFFAVGVIILLVTLFGEEEEIDPVLTSFTAEAEEVVLGEPVVLQWKASHVSKIHITYGTPPQKITITDPDTSSYQLNLEASGLYDIILEVENSGGIRSLNVPVRVLPAIESFTASPDIPFEHVYQELTLSWQVKGANAVYLEGENLSLSNLPPEGSHTLDVYPLDILSFTLHVTGEDNTLNRRDLNLAVIPPRCNLSNPEAHIYTGPGLTFELLETLTDSETTINPIARNNDSTWLEISHDYAGGETAWVRRADFACQEFSPENLNIAAQIPPSPTPTFTATPSPTTTFTPSPTETPLPTATPSPTVTPLPTETPLPKTSPTRLPGHPPLLPTFTPRSRG